MQNLKFSKILNACVYTTCLLSLRLKYDCYIDESLCFYTKKKCGLGTNNIVRRNLWILVQFPPKNLCKCFRLFSFFLLGVVSQFIWRIKIKLRQRKLTVKTRTWLIRFSPLAGATGRKGRWPIDLGCITLISLIGTSKLLLFLHAQR